VTKIGRLSGSPEPPSLAISGFNIAIVAGIPFFLLRWLWALSPRLCLRFPAQRAALIGSAALGGLAQPARALALAWIAIVAVDPLVLMTPGLWLSFGAVAAIFLAASGRVAQPAAWRAAIRLQLMLSVVLAPLTLYFFQGTSLSGPLINLVAVPIVAILTLTVLAALIATWTLPVLGLPLLRHVADLLAWLQQGLIWIADHAHQRWVAASPPTPALLLAGLGALLLFARRGMPLRRLGLLCWLPLLLPLHTAPARDSASTGSTSARVWPWWYAPRSTPCCSIPAPRSPTVSMPAARRWCRTCCTTACGDSIGWWYRMPTSTTAAVRRLCAKCCASTMRSAPWSTSPAWKAIAGTGTACRS
jgi:hypothetical protein